MHREKLIRLLDRYEGIVLLLRRYADCATQREIDEFFYLQKIAEMKLLLDLFAQEPPPELPRDHLEHDYKKYYCRWRHDYRWLTRHIHALPTKTIL